jgi:hypothetical protein
MLVAGSFSPAHATFVPAPSTITIGVTGESIFFTYAGYDGTDDRDQLRLIGNGVNTLVFTNKTTPVGTVFSSGPLAAGQYSLQLWDKTTNEVFYSDRSKNPHHDAYLMETSNFADFDIGAAPFASALYFGWEDERPTHDDADYSDLIFTIFVDPPLAVPEPSSLSLFLAALAGLALLAWRQRARSRPV